MSVANESLSHRLTLSHEFGDILVTRSMGAKVAETITNALNSISKASCLYLDWSGVDIVDYSCADEMVGKIVARMVAGEFGERYLLLDGLRDSLVENVECSLLLRELPAVSITHEGYRILGSLKPHLAEAVQILVSRQESTARDVAESLGIALNTASNRLIELHRLKLAWRTESSLTGGGKQYIYGIAARVT